MTPLMQALMARAPRMQFFQLCRLLELQAPESPGLGTQDNADHEPVRFRPWPRMGFPASEVSAVEQDEEHPHHPPDVRTTFMGLYGVDAAMPSHLVNDIALRREGYEAVMAFLDMYHHRLVTLLYRTWSKYRYPMGFTPGGRDERSRDLLALAGFGLGEKPAKAGLPDSRVLALLGLLNQRTRTAEGLAGVVMLAVPGVGVDVEEFHSVWIKVDAPACLGRSVREDDASTTRGLGQGDVIGRRIRCRTKTVRITLRPRSAEQVEALLPGSTSYRDLMGFLRSYIGVKADAVLRMRADSALMPAPKLGDSRSRMSWTMLLKPSMPQTLDIPLGRYEAFPSPAMASAPACAAGVAA
ncbi:hypothetical protein GCM10011408_19230 [Dyella caseinilytica]|nr:hypothetical protein GCM10011408_19230 [Dyella caseinilytica]